MEKPVVPDWIHVIDAARAKRGRSRKQLAERASIEPSTFNNWFGDEAGDPGFSKVAAVCEALEISLDSLVGPGARPSSSLMSSQVLRAVAATISDAAAAAEVVEAAHAEESVELQKQRA